MTETNDTPAPPAGPSRSRLAEAATLGALSALLYGGLAVFFCLRTPRLFSNLDVAFDADLGFWTSDLARPQSPHPRTKVHPLTVLLLNPLGFALRLLLVKAGVAFAARLAAALLCAAAGALAVVVFRALLRRLGIPDGHARLWTLVYALSASQVFFSSVPESYAFSGASLVLVFAVAASPQPAEWRRLGAGILAFGMTVTNLVAVALARLTAFDRRRPRLALAGTAGHVGLVVAAVAVLALAQWFVYPTSEPFFMPSRVAAFYTGFTYLDAGPEFWLRRAGTVLSHVFFCSLAPARIRTDGAAPPYVNVNFAPVALAEPTVVGALHWLLWAVVLVQAGRGVWPRARAGGRAGSVLTALLLWLAFVVSLHLVFGRSLFLYSAHWVFAVVALAAAGLDERPLAGARATSRLLLALIGLQAAAVLALVRQIAGVLGTR